MSYTIHQFIEAEIKAVIDILDLNSDLKIEAKSWNNLLNRNKIKITRTRDSTRMVKVRIAQNYSNIIDYKVLIIQDFDTM